MVNGAKNFAVTDWPTDNTGWDTNVPEYKEEDMHYLIIGRETAPETGRKHFQIYVQFKKKISYGKAKSYFSTTAHVEAAKGNPKSNIEYCNKSGDFSEFGIPVAAQGKRNDIAQAKSILDSGGSLTNVADECFGVFLRYESGLLKYQQLKLPTDRTNFTSNHITILWGDAGSGKSRTATHCDSVQVLQYNPVSTFWSAPWDGSKRVVIDDLDAGTMRPRDLWLRIFDPHTKQLSLNVKGGRSKFAPEEIYITSNFDPHGWFPDDPAWQRRLTEFCTIRHMVGFVDVAMRRFFEPVPQPTAMGTGLVATGGSDSTSESGDSIVCDDSSYDDADSQDSEYSRRVRRRLLARANANAEGSEYVHTMGARRHCAYADTEAVQDDSGVEWASDSDKEDL